MKKTVSINIGSIIFHIEEDGYDKLKSYLDSVNRYFSTFEDSSEIIADIENRIAEIFLEKLTDGRQTVSLEDVDELIATMGTTRDFEATIETEPKEEAKEEPVEPEPESQAQSEQQSQKSEAPRKLYRDIRRKMLGGVASGIAYYFRIDPLWIRLLTLALFFNVFFAGLSGATLLAYIILWIVIPGNSELEDDKKIKKLFRDSDSRVLGGVASGIARYFGADIAVIRLLFVLSIFLAGSGILLYIILWIITPEARTITEKMQMQGEPVTLSNIEENVKKGLNVKDGEESAIVKILLFPFRLIALIINGIGRALGPLLKFLVELLRIAFGVLLVIIGFSIMIGLVVAMFGILGMGGWEHYTRIDDIPLELIRDSLNDWVVISAFLVSFVPALGITLAGLAVILKKRIVKPYVAWAMLGVWVISLAISSYAIPSFIREFSSEDDIRVDKTFELTQATPTLHLNDLGDDSFDGVDLRLRGHSDSTYQLLLTIESRGGSREEAQENARSIVYNVEQKGDDFYFDSRVTFPEGSEFRFQNVKAYFYIPFGKTFRMDGNLDEILINTLHLNGYRSYQMEGNDWVFERSGIKCLTCPEQNYEDADDNVNDQIRSSYRGSDKIDYPFTDFDEVVVAAFIDIDISRGDEWSVVLRGDDNDLDDVYVNQVGDKLTVKFKEDNWEWWKERHDEKIGLFITMPELNYLELTGDCDGEIKGFESEDLTINAVGGCDLYINVTSNDLDINLTGASTAELKGSGERLNVELIGASRLEGFDFTASRADVSAVGASKAEVYASDELDLEAAGASKIRYRGTHNVDASDLGMSSIERD